MKCCFIYLTKPSDSTPDRLSGIRLMLSMLKEYGVTRDQYRTISMTALEGGRKPSAEDIKRNQSVFLEAIGTEPVILAAMGSSVMNPLTKNFYPISNTRGEAMPVTDAMPYPKGSFIYGMFDPIAVWNDPGCEDLFRRDIRHLAALMNGTPEKDPVVDNLVLHEAHEVNAFAKALPGLWNEIPEPERFLVVDCEWQGRNWKEPGHYIRTVQIGYAPGMAVTVEIYREHPDFNNDSIWPKKVLERKAKIKDCLDHPVCLCNDLPALWKSLKSLLQDSGYPIIGHNIIADWQWLLTFGVDIRQNVIFDTMLAEHLINSDGPFRLDEVAMRRTPWGRYCRDVDVWVSHHKDFCSEGYGAVPSALLMPYGGADVDCPRMIMKAQLPLLAKYGMLNPRGPQKEYPSLLDSTLLNELATDELERNGLPVDRQRLSELIDAYQAMRAQLLSEITLMAMSLGMPDFNPNSQLQMRTLLFNKLGLTPVKTTGGQSWGDVAGNYEMDDENAPASSTDKSVLEMLQSKHPLVKKLLQFRRIDQTCKTWLRHPNKDGEGGLEPLIWSDGHLHASFLPTTSTGRYKTSNPNCVPKEVEVLTSHGWLHWDEAYARRDEPGMLLAQWDPESKNRDISFAKPLEWHYAVSELIHIKAGRHFDIRCTPSHRFVVYDRKSGKHITVPASELESYREYQIPHCGYLSESPGKRHLTDDEITILCATQADSYISKVKYKGVPSEFGVSYDFSKDRKTTRIRSALDNLGIPYRVSEGKTSIGTRRTRIYVEKKYRDRLFTDFRHFSDRLMEFDADTLRRIADEVFLWDGCATHVTRMNYASAIRSNTEWVQAIESMFGRRARGRVYVSKCGNPSYQIDVCGQPFSSLYNVTIESVPEPSEVYCATMPLGTILLKNAGNVILSANSQNFPKKAEGYLTEIFGEGHVPPTLRTIVAPPEGYMMMEGDFCQAELFTMANVSGDQNMIRLLTTPGLDLHDSTTLSSFNMKMLDEHDNEVTEDDLVKLAAEIGDESDEFQHYMKAMRYLQVDGKIITRAQFKSGPRISAKSLNFGIPLTFL